MFTIDECDDIGQRIFSLIRPYYKRPNSNGRPEFKKALTGKEIEKMLMGLHEIVVVIKRKHYENEDQDE